jgi:hypothetical protein
MDVGTAGCLCNIVYRYHIWVQQSYYDKQYMYHIWKEQGYYVKRIYHIWVQECYYDKPYIIFLYFSTLL